MVTELYIAPSEAQKLSKIYQDPVLPTPKKFLYFNQSLHSSTILDQSDPIKEVDMVPASYAKNS